MPLILEAGILAGRAASVPTRPGMQRGCMFPMCLIGVSMAAHRLCEAAGRQQLWRHVGHSAIRLGGDMCFLVHIQHPREPKVCQLHSAQPQQRW